MKLLARLLVALVIGAAPLQADGLPTAAPEAVGLSSEKLDALKTHFQGYVDSGKLAGLTTLVARHGKVVQFETYGVLNKETGQAMTADAVFRIYSMTKPITGAGLMQLYEQGLFRLDDPVSNYLPEFANVVVFKARAEDGTVETEPVRRPVQIIDLMRHTAGLTYGVFGDTLVDQMYRENGVIDGTLTLAEWVRRLAAQPLLYQPGDRWVYSFSVDVQGALIEKLSGQTLDRYLADHVFKPLGMKDTAFYADAARAARLAEMYAFNEDKVLAPYRGSFWQDFTVNPTLLSGGGGLVSTTLDYWRFCQMMLNGGVLDGVRVLKADTVSLMATDHLPASLPGIDGGKKGLGFGLDFAVVREPEKQGHGARMGEYFWGGMANTVFWIDPKDDIIAILMTNILPSGIYPLRDDLRQHVYDAVLE